MARALCLFVLLALAQASPARAEVTTQQARGVCMERLAALGVDARPAQGPGLAIGVVVRSPIAGVSYRSFRDEEPRIDCAMAVALAKVGPILRSLGIDKVTFSSAYQRRRIRGSKHLSKHSFGLALDVHVFEGEELGRVSIVDDYEQGLGDASDCEGAPLTEAGRSLRRLECQLRASGVFELILSPDDDAHHYNHFHLQVAPWSAQR